MPDAVITVAYALGHASWWWPVGLFGGLAVELLPLWHTRHTGATQGGRRG